MYFGAIEPKTFLLDEWSGFLKTLNVVDALSDVMAIVGMYNIEDRFADKIVSTRRSPKFHCRGIEIRKLIFLVNDDGIG